VAEKGRGGDDRRNDTLGLTSHGVQVKRAKQHSFDFPSPSYSCPPPSPVSSMTF